MKRSPIFTIVALSSVLALVGCGASNTNSKGGHISHGSFSVAKVLKPTFGAAVGQKEDADSLVIKYYGAPPTVSSDAFGNNSGVKLVKTASSAVKDFLSNTFTDDEPTETFNVVFQPTASTPLGANKAEINISQDNSDSNGASGSKETVTFNNNSGVFKSNIHDIEANLVAGISTPAKRVLNIQYQGDVAPVVDSPAFTDKKSGFSKQQSTTAKVENYFTNVFSSSWKQESFTITYAPNKDTPATNNTTLSINQGSSSSNPVTIPISLNNNTGSFSYVLRDSTLAATPNSSVSTHLIVNYTGNYKDSMPQVSITGGGSYIHSSHTKSYGVEDYTITFNSPIDSTATLPPVKITIKQPNSKTDDVTKSITLSRSASSFKIGNYNANLTAGASDKTATETFTVGYNGNEPTPSIESGAPYITVSSPVSSSMLGYDSADKYTVTYTPAANPNKPSYQGDAVIDFSQRSQGSPNTDSAKIHYEQAKGTFAASLSPSDLVVKPGAKGISTLTVSYSGRAPTLIKPGVNGEITVSGAVSTPPRAGSVYDAAEKFTVTYNPAGAKEDAVYRKLDLTMHQDESNTDDTTSTLKYKEDLGSFTAKLALASGKALVAADGSSDSAVLTVIYTGEEPKVTSTLAYLKVGAPTSTTTSSGKKDTYNITFSPTEASHPPIEDKTGNALLLAATINITQDNTISDTVKTPVNLIEVRKSFYVASYNSLLNKFNGNSFVNPPGLIKDYPMVPWKDGKPVYSIDAAGYLGGKELSRTSAINAFFYMANVQTTEAFKAPYSQELASADSKDGRAVISLDEDSKDYYSFDIRTQKDPAPTNLVNMSAAFDIAYYSHIPIMVAESVAGVSKTYNMLFAGKNKSNVASILYLSSADPVHYVSSSPILVADNFFRTAIDEVNTNAATVADAKKQNNEIVLLNTNAKQITFYAPHLDASGKVLSQFVQLNNPLALGAYQTINCSSVKEDPSDLYPLPQTCYLAGVSSAAATSINYAIVTIKDSAATVKSGTISSASINIGSVGRQVMQVNGDTGEMMVVDTSGKIYKANLTDATPKLAPISAPSRGTPYAVYQD